MNITPINAIVQLSDLANITKTNTVSNDAIDSFKNIFQGLINNVKEAEQASQLDIFNIAQGNADDLHNITINSEKAELATLTLIQVRNKVLDAYNEIMRINL